MVSYPPHPVTSSNDVASTNVSGAENENQSRKPGQTDAERDQPIVNTERPSFGQWLKAAWPDLLTMIIVGAVGLGVSQSSP